MIRNYLKTAWRSIIKSKLFSSIKILGLALGIIISLPIFLIIKDELTFDNFHSKKDRIYRTWIDEEYGDGVDYLSAVTPKVLGNALANSIPEVEEYTRLETLQEYIQHDDQIFDEQFTFVDPGFFTIFDFPVASGSVNGVFQDLYEVVISEGIAQKYFGDEDPIGQMLKIRMTDEFQSFRIVAVLENPPSNSSVQYSLLVPFENMRKRVSENNMTSWFNISCETYVLLNNQIIEGELDGKVKSMLQTALGEDYTEGSYTVGFQPLEDIHLNTEIPQGIAQVSDPRYSIILGAIALLVLILGCINFITMALGQSLSRVKEVGVRKVVGASRKQISMQFLGEAFLVALIALVIAVAAMPVLLPYINNLTNRVLELTPSLTNVIFVLLTLAVIVLISGSYPSFLLSKIQPALIVKGKTNTVGGKQKLLRWLIGAQLVLSLFLISCTLLMKNQLNFIQEKNLGFDADQTIVVAVNSTNSSGIKPSVEKALLLKNKLERQAGVNSVALSLQEFSGTPWMSASFPDENGTVHGFNFNVVSPEFIPAMDIELLQGKNFTGWEGENNNGLIINEAFAKYFGWEEPIGQSLPGKEFIAHEVIGVVKDFNYMSLKNTIEPLALVVNPELIFSGINNISINQDISPKAFIKLQGGQIAEGVELVRASWDATYPGEPFEFSFLDSTIERQYEAEQRLEMIITVAAFLAVIIAAMGLFGLSSLTINNRTKEIGIRKVLGARVSDITFMFTKEFIIVAIVALLISVPFTIYFMNQWLQDYQYRTTISAELFLWTGIIGILVCVITVSTQSLKAAYQNPVDSIGSE